MLPTVNKTIAVNAVFQFWPRVELPNLFPKWLLEHQKLKIVKSNLKLQKQQKEKSSKNKHKSNIVSKKRKKDMKIDMMSVTRPL